MSIATIPPAEVQARLAAGRPTDLIDVRTPAEFAAVHAVGAVLHPLDRLDPQAVAAARTAAHEPAYVLCHSGSRARTAAERLTAAGVPCVVVDGGTKAWDAAGLPVVRGGGSTFGVERQVRSLIGLGVLTGAVLAIAVEPRWAVLSGFFGAGLLLAGLTDRCPLALLVAAMPWNRGAPAGSCCAPAAKPAEKSASDGNCCAR